MGYGMLMIQQAGRPDRLEPLDQQTLIVGRGPECTIILDYPAVSRRHLRLEWANEAYQVIDLASTHGVVVDGRRIDRPTPLRPRGRIWLGDALGNGVSLVYIREGEVLTEEVR